MLHHGLIDEASAIAGRIVDLRRAIHAEPELGLHTPRTRDKVRAALAHLPLEWREGTATTGMVATLKGSATPERTVLFGAHHDAWTFGGVDPGTGTTALLEVGRALGALAKTGWRPSRSIALAFWDAEELGLVGSTEYAEDQRARLQEQLVMYVNIDMYMKGRFDPGGVPSLTAFVADVARDVPQGASTVFDQWKAAELARLPAARRPADVSGFTPSIKALGSGADFVPFQDHLAVPTMAIEFIGDNGYLCGSKGLQGKVRACGIDHESLQPVLLAVEEVELQHA